MIKTRFHPKSPDRTARRSPYETPTGARVEMNNPEFIWGHCMDRKAGSNVEVRGITLTVQQDGISVEVPVRDLVGMQTSLQRAWDFLNGGEA